MYIALTPVWTENEDREIQRDRSCIYTQHHMFTSPLQLSCSSYLWRILFWLNSLHCWQVDILQLLIIWIVLALEFLHGNASWVWVVAQAVVALVNAAVKLVTHLALVPSSAAQFRKVLLDLPPESRQQLQVCPLCYLHHSTVMSIVASLMHVCDGPFCKTPVQILSHCCCCSHGWK
jgi:hypothetical protein